MSGIEPCNVVLAAFPTLLAAIDGYGTGFGVLKFTGQKDWEIDVLEKRVRTEFVRLLELLETVFEPMGVEIGYVLKWDSTKMTASRLDALLEQRPRFAYPAFVELTSSIAICVSELVRRFGKVDSTSALRTKLRLISSREDIERLVRKLTDYTDCLQSIVLLKRGLYTAHAVESINVRVTLFDAKMAQRDANILYQALYPVKEKLSFRKVFIESFRIAHSSQYRRQLQLLLIPPDSSASRIRPSQDHWLKVCVKFDKELERSEFHNLRTDRELDVPAIGLASSIDLPTDKQRKSVRFQKSIMSQSEVRQQSRPAKVVSLSEFSNMFHASESPSKYGPILIGDPAMLIDETDMLSLRDILRSSIRISHLNRIRLAASLTWDVICLIDTPWMKRGLKVADIFFTKNHDVIRVDDLFICHSFDQENIEQADPRSLIQGQIFRLGVILFELSLHENIEDLQEGQQPDGIPDELAEHLLISRMIDDVYRLGGIKYGDLVKRCVSFQFDSSLNSQHPKILEEIQNSLIREVFSPLEDLLKLFGSLDSEATINLAGSQAKSPKPKLLSDDSSIQGLYTPSTRPSIDTLRDDSSIDDRASTIDKIQGLHESSTRTPLEDFCLQHLSLLHRYASEVCQKGYADTFAFARVMLAAKETLLSIAEADDLAHRILPDSSLGEELLYLSRNCLTDFVRLETFRQGAEDREALDDLTNRFTLDGGSLALFNERVLRFPSKTTDSEISSVISASGTDLSSIFDGKASGSSTATSLLEPVWADSRQVADELLSLIRDEALLGPLLMSVFEELEALDNIPLRSYLLCLLDKYSEELLLQARQEFGTGSQRQAAMMIYYQASYIVDKMYAEYSFRDRSASKMLEQVMLRIPGEMHEQRSQRVSRIVANFAKVATRSELPEGAPSIVSTEGAPSIVSTDGSFHRDYSAIPAFMTQTGFERRSAASLGFTTIDSNAKIVFVVVKDFLVSGIAFAHLRLALRDTLQQKPMDIVRQEVFSGIPSSDENSYDVTFHVYWDIRQYIKNELTPRQTFASVLTVSGGSRDAFATPCGSYMQWLWSDASIDLLDAIDQTMKHGKYVSAEGSLQISEEDPNQSNLDYKLSISVVGTKYKVSEVAQQLVWLSNVLRTTYTNELSLSRMEFMWIDQGRFELRPGRLAAVPAENDSCWHPLLGKTVIADGFPIPPRDGEVGLELPFQSLIRLSKVDAEMEFDNRVVLYGTSSLLYPTSLSVESYTQRTTPRCIQWHLIAGESPHISASLLAEDQNWVKVDDKTFLPTGRSIVGYCKTARILVGTEEYKYDETKGSELSDDESMPGVNIKSINLGTAGMGVFGVQVAMDVEYTRSVEVSPEIAKYDDILVTARKMSMILYDSGEQRGWLLPVQHVLLHMAQCWIKRHTPGVNLTYAKPEWEGENAIEKILIDNYKLLVKTLLDDDSEWFLRDLVKQIWRDLQGCRIARKQRRSENRANQTLPSAKLLAWEFLEFIDRPPEFRMRRFPIEFSGCGWDALAEDDDMMILACRGLGDVILPAATVQLCKKWSTVPSNRAYLTASISCMRIVPESRVGGLCMSLTRRVFWRPTAQSLLDDCAHDGHTNCGKSLQKVITKVDAAPIASTAFPPSGAVVFGVNRLHRSLKQFGEVQHRRAQKDESDEAHGKKSRWHIFKRSNK